MMCLHLGLGYNYAQEKTNTDTTGVINKKSLRHVRIGIDVLKPILFSGSATQKSYEGFVDYYLNKELYLVLEAGLGSSRYPYNHLNYSSTNTFFKLGFDKSLLPRITPNDWDMVSLGLRYGLGLVKRGEAVYTVKNTVFGGTAGTIPASNLTAHWGEITAGMRMYLWRQIGAGWNMRGKFLLNARGISELPPAYIAGYGRGDKGTVFDANVYLTYNIGFSRK